MQDLQLSYPKISIVTPSFNQGKYIEQTIQSVLNQNYPNLEYIIIDGGSTDETVEIIKKYEQQLAYWVSEPDKGQTDAINKGFAKCTGEIFNWINSDDYYEQGTFEKLAKLFSDNANINVISGKEWSFHDEMPEKKTLNAGSIIKKNVYETIRVGIIDQPCTFFRKKKIDAFFPLAESLHYVMDRQLWWSYLLEYGQGQILQTDEIFTWFRLHPQSKSIEQQKYFEGETDLLRLSLFTQLNAPLALEDQLNADQWHVLTIKWNIQIPHPTKILAAFATHYGEQLFVKHNLACTAKLMKPVWWWKGIGMNAKEWKLWIAACVIPLPITSLIKKLKK